MSINVPESSGGPRRALVVTAEPDRGVELERGFAEIGLEPTIISDARGADQLTTGALPDALVLDRGMPGLALFRLYSALRGRPGGTEMPIFFVGEPGTDTPTDHYLSRDATPDEIVDRVRTGLGLTRPAADQTPSAFAADDDAPPVIVPIDAADDAPTTLDVDRPIIREGAETVTATRASPVIESMGAPVQVEPVVPTIEAGPARPPVETETRQPSVDAAPRPIEAVGPAPLIVGAVGTAAVGAAATAPTAEPERADVEPERAYIEPERVAAEPAPAGEPRRSRVPSLDVWLLRLGLLLLIGGAILLLRPDSSTQPIAPPNLPTATPAATRAPVASPSPAAVAPATTVDGR